MGDSRGFRPPSLPGLLAFSGRFWPPNKNFVLFEYYCVLKMQKLRHKSVCDFTQAHTGK